MHGTWRGKCECHKVKRAKIDSTTSSLRKLSLSKLINQVMRAEVDLFLILMPL